MLLLVTPLLICIHVRSSAGQRVCRSQGQFASCLIYPCAAGEASPRRAVLLILMSGVGGNWYVPNAILNVLWGTRLLHAKSKIQKKQ